MINSQQIAGTILAGGKASRMGFRDKALFSLMDKPLIEHVIEKARPQVNELVISVNRNREKYVYLDLPLLPDTCNSYSGPLVGIASSMYWLQANRVRQDYQYLVCFAADVPCFPRNFVQKLALELVEADADLAVCKSGDQLQPLFSLWSMACLPTIAAAIEDGCYGPKLIMPRLASIEVEVLPEHPADFYNINTEQCLDAVKKLLRAD